MPELLEPRVAVYLDFDNIVLSWYDRVHGRGSASRDRTGMLAQPPAPEFAQKLAAARIDVGAVLDYAASFGTLVLTRAYADWSAPINADYRNQLVARAVDLVQLFPAAAGAKNGADIRLAVDAVEDMFRLPDLTHVVIAAGDSDYVPLAQRCKRLGRIVVGVGVAGSTAKSLAAACDQFDSYDALPGVTLPPSEKPKADGQKQRKKKKAEDAPGELLDRALRLELERTDTDWVHSSAVKSLMKRIDPSFNEKTLGYKTFSDFVRAYDKTVELSESSQARLMRLVPDAS